MAKKGFNQIKMDGRLARRLLASGECKVKLSGIGCIYTTKQGVVYCGSHEEVYVKELEQHIKTTLIEKIEYTDRFGLTSFMSIAWEN